MYREFGVNPAGGCLPTLIQFPVLIGLYQSITRVLATSPLQLVDLAHRVYLPGLAALVPLNDSFLWLDLGRPDPFYVLPVLVVATTWAQQKLLSPPNPDPQSQSMTQSMQIMMPLMFPLMLYKAPSGVNLYIMSSTFAGVFEQYVIRKHIREKEEAESKGLVSVTSKTGGKVKKKKPKPFFKNM